MEKNKQLSPGVSVPASYCPDPELKMKTKMNPDPTFNRANKNGYESLCWSLRKMVANSQIVEEFLLNCITLKQDHNMARQKKPVEAISKVKD